MKPSTKDKTSGKVHEVKGRVKEKAGQLTNNPDLEAEGRTKRWRESPKENRPSGESPRKIVWTTPQDAGGNRCK